MRDTVGPIMKEGCAKNTNVSGSLKFLFWKYYVELAVCTPDS